MAPSSRAPSRRMCPNDRLREGFVLFAVYERDACVGKVALLPSWSENDVMTELQVQGYPTNGRVKFCGWPSATGFVLEVEGDELRRFRFERMG